MLKEYAEKAKARSSELEIQNAEYKGVQVELQNKMQRYRKSYRDLGKVYTTLQFIFITLNFFDIDLKKLK